MSGKKHRQKGDRLERELVEKHREIGVHAERYPLSGASRYRGSGHDLDVYAFGKDAAPLVAEVKGRKNGAGFTVIEKWLGEYDALFLRRNRGDPMVVLPWDVWHRIIEHLNGCSWRERGLRAAAASLSRAKVPDGLSSSRRRVQDDPATTEDS